MRTGRPGQHEAIIDPELWQIVQDKLAANRHERSLAIGAKAPSLLAGLIVDAGGNRLTPNWIVFDRTPYFGDCGLHFCRVGINNPALRWNLPSLLGVRRDSLFEVSASAAFGETEVSRISIVPT
jgi:hypothetical protein